MKQLTGNSIGNSRGVEGFYNPTVGNTYIFPPIELAERYPKDAWINRKSTWIIRMDFAIRPFIVNKLDNPWCSYTEELI